MRRVVIAENKKYNEHFNHHEYVDLGLPSGNLWAACNVGAKSFKESGLYFQWGDPVGHSKEEVANQNLATIANYKWCSSSSNVNTLTKYCTMSQYGTPDGKTSLELEDDMAAVNMGGNWRTPSTTEVAELLNNCNSSIVNLDGVQYFKLTSKINNKEILFNISGYFYQSQFNNEIRLFTNEIPVGLQEISAWFMWLKLDGSTSYSDWTLRCNTLPVRGVISKLQK